MDQPAALSENSILSLLRAGDDRAAETLVRSHAPWMLAVARRMTRDHALAEDCVQEAFVNAFRKIGEFDDYACRIEAPWQHMATPDQVFEREDLRARVLSEIDRLPDNYRIVLQLRDIEEWTTAEVAAVLELSQENVKVRLHRARSALKKLLEPMLRGEL